MGFNPKKSFKWLKFLEVVDFEPEIQIDIDMNWLTKFPDSKTLLSMFPNMEVLNVNAHIHTPYSFSAFSDIFRIFEMAKQENVAALGINDFFVSDGYKSFHDEALKQGIFPLFNIEFIGLLKHEQQQKIRVNDPNNPGRCYFCGKGLDYPFHVDPVIAEKLETIIGLSQEQMKAMIEKINEVLALTDPGIMLDYDTIQATYSKGLVRERHLAKAIRMAIFDKYPENIARIAFFTRLFDNKLLKSSMADCPALENEIRANLLKSGGRAFVEEDEATFMTIDEIIEIILNAGGIPCYPVLLDDRNRNFTEFEHSPELLWKSLTSKNIRCIEFIPGRNDGGILEEYARYFYDKEFIILLGTEHNAPDMIPLTCDTRGNIQLPEQLIEMSYKGACVVAAHQYLKARGSGGFVDASGTTLNSEKDYFIKLGNAVMHYHRQSKI